MKFALFWVAVLAWPAAKISLAVWLNRNPPWLTSRVRYGRLPNFMGDDLSYPAARARLVEGCLESAKFALQYYSTKGLQPATYRHMRTSLHVTLQERVTFLQEILSFVPVGERGKAWKELEHVTEKLSLLAGS